MWHFFKNSLKNHLSTSVGAVSHRSDSDSHYYGRVVVVCFLLFPFCFCCVTRLSIQIKKHRKCLSTIFSNMNGVRDNEKESVQEEEQLQQEKASFFSTESGTGTTGNKVQEWGRSGSDVRAEDKDGRSSPLAHASSFLFTKSLHTWGGSRDLTVCHILNSWSREYKSLIVQN